MPRLIDFQHPDEASHWRAINDGVMGGVSRSDMRCQHGAGLFSGELSLEYGGGFASVRRQPEAWNLRAHAGLRLRVRGDGRAYQLRLYTPQLARGAAYRARFQPAADSWQSVELPWQAFAAVFRGRLLEAAPPLDPGAIRQAGLMIADRTSGPFRLEVAWLETMDAGG